MKTLYNLIESISGEPAPCTFDLVQNIYQNLGGTGSNFGCTYDIVQSMLDEGLIGSGSQGVDLTSGVKFAWSTFTSIPEGIAESNWEDLTSSRYMFLSCSNLVSVPSLDLSNVEDTVAMFRYCNSLENLEGFPGLHVSLSLEFSPNLTRQSVLNVIEKADDLSETTGSFIHLHDTTKELLTEEDYELASSKGWSII